MGVQLMEESRRAGVEKFVAIGTVCACPKFTPLPFREADLVNLGSGDEISIRDLVHLIAQATGFPGSDHVGYLDAERSATSEARHESRRVGVRFPLGGGSAEGLRETVEWYERDRLDSASELAG